MAFIKYVILQPVFGILISGLKIYELILIIRIILSWVNPDPYNPIVRFIYSITDPLLYYIRRLIPLRIGMLDLSPIFAFILIEIIIRGLLWLTR